MEKKIKTIKSFLKCLDDSGVAYQLIEKEIFDNRKSTSPFLLRRAEIYRGTSAGEYLDGVSYAVKKIVPAIVVNGKTYSLKKFDNKTLKNKNFETLFLHLISLNKKQEV